jgi:hypothetical protein
MKLLLHELQTLMALAIKIIAASPAVAGLLGFVLVSC